MTPIRNAYSNYLKPAFQKHPVISTAAVIAAGALCYVAISWARSNSPTKPDDKKPVDKPEDKKPPAEPDVTALSPDATALFKRRFDRSLVQVKSRMDPLPSKVDPTSQVPLLDRLTVQYSRWLPAPFTRNVLFVGSTRTGKSCAAKTMTNPFYVPPGMTMFSATRKPGMLHTNLGRCTVHFLDTPGLNDNVTVDETGTRLSNPQIVEMVHKAVHGAFGNYHNVSRVFMTLTVGSIIADQLNAIEAFISALPEGISKTLLLTHAENTPPDDRADVIQQLKDHPRVGKIIAKHFQQGDEILFFGAQSQEKWHSMLVSSIRNKTKTIHEFRKNLIGRIFNNFSAFDPTLAGQLLREACENYTHDLTREHFSRFEFPKKTRPDLTALQITALEDEQEKLQKELQTRLNSSCFKRLTLEEKDTVAQEKQKIVTGNHQNSAEYAGVNTNPLYKALAYLELYKENSGVTHEMAYQALYPIPNEDTRGRILSELWGVKETGELEARIRELSTKIEKARYDQYVVLLLKEEARYDRAAAQTKAENLTDPFLKAVAFIEFNDLSNVKTAASEITDSFQSKIVKKEIEKIEDLERRRGELSKFIDQILVKKEQAAIVLPKSANDDG